FLVAPMGLAALAGVLHQYPYGASRVMAFAAAAALLLTAVGLGRVFALLRCPRSFWGVWPATLVPRGLCFPVGHAGSRMIEPWERADSDRATALVRDRCRSGEWVVGTLWEHAYYFHGGEGNYRPLLAEPTAPPYPLAFVKCRPAEDGQRMWLLASGRKVEEQAAWIDELGPAGAWVIRESYSFVR